MKPILTAVTLAAALAAALAATAAWAHGDRPHANKPGAAAVVIEQKPWGIAGDPKAASRTIVVSMHDTMRFQPDAIEVRQGETIRFVVRNDGRILHELVIGTKEENDKHAELMLKFPNMEHDEPYMAHVDPGKREEIVWTFNRPGRFEFACLIPGHYQAGMVGIVDVIPSEKQRKSR